MRYEVYSTGKYQIIMSEACKLIRFMLIMIDITKCCKAIILNLTLAILSTWSEKWDKSYLSWAGAAHHGDVDQERRRPLYWIELNL